MGRTVLGSILGIEREPDRDRFLPYVRGSETSEEAARTARPNAGTKRKHIYERICNRPSTDDELEEATGWPHQTVSARRRELVLDGLVEDSGETRKTRSGRSATVWRAT